jgi:hypothetical protein
MFYLDCDGARSLRSESQHDHASATAKTKMHVPLIGLTLLLIICVVKAALKI